MRLALDVGLDSCARTTRDLALRSRREKEIIIAREIVGLVSRAWRRRRRCCGARYQNYQNSYVRSSRLL